MPDDEKDPREATSTADTFHRHGTDTAGEEQPTVTGRPNDIPIDEPAPAPLGGNTTFADRAKAAAKQEKAGSKQVDEDNAEDKAVTSAATKSKRARKS